VPEPIATVITVNWNGERLLRSCLDALARQQTSAPFETWVVDNASSDGSVALLEREYPSVRVIRNTENLGFAGGNNVALRQVTTPYAVLLNNDATPEPDWLENLLGPFQGPDAERVAVVTSKVVFQPTFLRLTLSTQGFVPGGGDPRELGIRLFGLSVEDVSVTDRVLMERLSWGVEGTGLDRFRWTKPAGELLVPLPDGHPGPYEVCVRAAAEATKPVTLTWDGGSTTFEVGPEQVEHVFEVPRGTPSYDVLNNVGSIVTRTGYGADRGFQEVDEGQYDKPEEVFALCGCAVAIRTEAGSAADWFDDDFFMYYEDTDLSWRLRAAGWSIRYEPSAVVRHVHAASSGEWSPNFTFHATRNRLLMLAKEFDVAVARREWAAFFLSTLQVLRPVIGAVRRLRRPQTTQLRMRLRILRSLLRLAPRQLRHRRQIARTAAVPRRELEEWLVAPR
jgi:GT2 family glycosyltransferase